MRRKTFFLALTSFCIGIAIAEQWGIPAVVWGAVVVLLVAGRLLKRAMIVWLSIALLLGAVRSVAWTESSLRPWQPLLGQTVALTGVIISAGPPADVAGIHSPARPGIIRLSGVSAPIGRTVDLTCRLSLIDDQLWRRLSNRRYLECSAAKFTTRHRQPDNWRGWLAYWRAGVSDHLIGALRTDPGALAVGLVFGDATQFSDTLRAAFRQTGTTHIVALSGFNITIIVAVMLEGLAPWLGRRWAVWGTTACLLLFIIVTGASASVIRAALMAACVIGARFAGRPIDPLRPLLYAVAMMVVANPALLLHDLGFQLSLSSTLGLLMLSAPIESRLMWLTDRYSFRSNVATTLAATVASFPIMATAFERLSLVSLLVNAAVLPLIPLAMALSAGHTLVATYMAPLLPLSRPVTEVVLSTITAIISVGAQAPLAAVALSPVIISAGVAVSIGILLVSMRYATSHSSR